jgi:hypothetical protein
MPVNSSAPTLGNSAIGSKADFRRAARSGGFIPVRVVDVSLSTSTNSTSTFQVSSQYAGIGAIRFEPLNKGSIPKSLPQGNIAIPLDNNIKKIPLLNEIVFIIAGPSYNTLLEENPDSIQFYYMNALNVWNRSHLNMLPSPSSGISANTDTVENSKVNSGVENNEDNQVQEPVPGKTFTEKSDIKNLFPNEGDVIIEGRFGNSIRFGSTSKQPSGSENVQSPWSSTGPNGSPITIIRNGQNKADTGFNDWFPIYEDIQNDDSSIYMTSGQTIPVRLGSTNFSSFGVDAIPAANTTKLLQSQPVENELLSNKQLDATGSAFDIVNVEPTIPPTDGV